MRNSLLSILVVDDDDAKFSSVMIDRTLNLAGYTDIRFASSATEALILLEERPAGILLADWLMPETDWLELTAKVRQHDEEHDHYTYIILLTGREGDNALAEAFDRGVDDFISKITMNEQLIPRIFAAERIYNTLTCLIKEKQLLTRNFASLESRDDTLCYLLTDVENKTVLFQQYGRTVYKELLRSIARRLQQLVRPLYVLVRIDGNNFVLIIHMKEHQEYSPASFKCIYDVLNMNLYKTNEGFIKIQVGVSLIELNSESLPVTADQLMHLVAKNIPNSYSSAQINAVRLHLPPQ